MHKELEIWKFAVDRLRLDEILMLLVVAQSSGSSPGRQGFKMIVAHDGMLGSIGGGLMEVALVEKAKLQISDFKIQNNSQIVEQVHQKNSPNSSGMICSGRQTVIFYSLDSRYLETIQQIIQSLENNQRKRVQISNLKFEVSEEIPGNSAFSFVQKSEGEFLYEEELGFKNRLFIIGGGHCALALSELMSAMDFHISLFDDRGDLNTLEKNRFVDEKMIVESYEKIGDFIESGMHHYVVVMTLGYKFDEIVIRRLFDKDFKYFGVLGSRAKMKTLIRNLEKEGFDHGRLNQIRTPIGLPINSQTPEEIAVSIGAEIIAVKNGAKS